MNIAVVYKYMFACVMPILVELRNNGFTQYAGLIYRHIDGILIGFYDESLLHNSYYGNTIYLLLKICLVLLIISSLGHCNKTLAS